MSHHIVQKFGGKTLMNEAIIKKNFDELIADFIGEILRGKSLVGDSEELLAICQILQSFPPSNLCQSYEHS